MKEICQWAIDPQNQGIISLIFSGIVAAATVVYAVLTASLVRETKRLRKAQTEPHVSIYLAGRDPANTIVDLVLRNNGFRQARHLNFSFDPDFEYFSGEKLSESEFFKGMSSLSPNEVRLLAMSPLYWANQEKATGKRMVPQVCQISVEYEDIIGKKFSETFSIPFSSYQCGGDWGEDPLKGIADSLKAISKSLAQAH